MAYKNILLKPFCIVFPDRMKTSPLGDHGHVTRSIRSPK